MSKLDIHAFGIFLINGSIGPELLDTAMSRNVAWIKAATRVDSLEPGEALAIRDIHITQDEFYDHEFIIKKMKT